MKKLTALLFVAFAFVCATAQTKTCTKEMAAKIASFLKTEKYGYGTLYLKANRDENKALLYLNDLPSHIDYADRFIFEILKLHGVQISLEIMTTSMQFTFDECIIAKEIYEQYEQEDNAKVKEQNKKKEEDERKLQDEIKEGKVLSMKEVTFLPQLHANISADSLICQWDRIEEWKRDRQAIFVVEVSADKDIRLIEGNKDLFKALQLSATSPAYKRLDNLKSRVPCACRLDIKLKTVERNYRGGEETVYYDKKKGWYAKPQNVQAGDKRIFGYNIHEKNGDLDEIRRQLAELGNDGNQKQGLCKAQIYKRTITLYMGDKVIQTGEAPNTVRLELIMQAK